jgi:hypothetical protein
VAAANGEAIRAAIGIACPRPAVENSVRTNIKTPDPFILPDPFVTV